MSKKILIFFSGAGVYLSGMGQRGLKNIISSNRQQNA